MLEQLILVSLKLLDGFAMTFKIFILTLALSLPLGLVISFGSRTRFTPLRWLVRTFIWIIRGTPLMLQLIIIFYGPGLIGKWALETGSSNIFLSWMSTWTVPARFTAVIVAFVINYSCYFSEIFRGGIEAIPKGQYEAGQVLGMKKSQVFFRVVLLQVVKHIVPPMSNEIITLVKDTSLARTIMVYEIIWEAQKFIKSAGIIWPLFYSGLYYLLFCGILTLLFGFIEKKLSYFR
jgi:polar amino acid transport system permease protein